MPQIKLVPRLSLLYLRIIDGVGVVITVAPKNETGIVEGDVIPSPLILAITTVPIPDCVNAVAPILVTEGGIVIDVK